MKPTTHCVWIGGWRWEVVRFVDVGRIGRPTETRKKEPTMNAEINVSSLRSHRNLTVKTGVKAGGLAPVHHTRALTVKTGVKAGGLATVNHGRVLTVKTGVKAGGLATVNHGRALTVK